MNKPDASGEQPQVYAVRLALSASDTIEQEHERLQDVVDSNIADDWQNGLLTAIRGLATYPARCAIAPENPLPRPFHARGTVRQLLYRRRRGPIWRILFTIHEADENDPATVQVHHIRHGAQAPLTEWPFNDKGSKE